MYKKVKILHIGLSHVWGGIESFLYNMSTKRDIVQDYVTFFENNDVISRFEKTGCTVHRLTSYTKLKSVISEYDIIHIHKNSAINILPFIIAKSEKKITIAHSHNTKPSINRFKVIFHLIHHCNRAILNKLADKKLACSTVAAEWLYGKKEVAKGNVTIINNGIDISKFAYNKEIRTQVRTGLGIEDKFVVGHVGRFSPQKHHSYLIDVFAEVYRRNSDSVLLLIGDGELKSVIENKVQTLGLSDSVVFLGIRDDVNDLYQAMDVFVMPSLWEGLSVAAVEAQAAGLAAVVSDVFAPETKIIDNFSFLSPNKSISEWADFITEKANTDRKDTSSDVTRAGYDIKDVTKGLADLYFDLIGKIDD
jgi:glycosyltransferase involved in cell wall biosynthesis